MNVWICLSVFYIYVLNIFLFSFIFLKFIIDNVRKLSNNNWNIVNNVRKL